MLESLGTVKVESLDSLMSEKPFYGSDIKQILDSLTSASGRLSDTMYILPFLGSNSDIEKVLQARVVEIRETLEVLERLRYSAHTGLSTIESEYYLRILSNESKGYLVRAYQYDGDFVDKEGKWYAPRWIQIEYILGRLYYSGPELYIYNRGENGEKENILVPVSSFIVSRYDYTISNDRNLYVVNEDKMRESFTKVNIERGKIII